MVYDDYQVAKWMQHGSPPDSFPELSSSVPDPFAFFETDLRDRRNASENHADGRFFFDVA